ncbi:MAG: tetratricopeptide repeat protein [Candidatus Desantisbacteria bacterium]
MNENEKNLNRLVDFIEAKPEHGIVLAEVNSIPLRDRLIERLCSLCSLKGLSVSTLSLANLPVYANIPVFIREELTNLPSQEVAPLADVISVIDFTNLLSKAEDEHNFMRGFNFSREVFIDIKLPVVFWLSTYIVNLMVQYAPDIWSWRSLVIKFEEERVPLTKEREEEFGSTESARVKIRKIGILETQLKDAVAKGVGAEEMARELFLPLAKAYEQNFDYKKAIEIYLEVLTIHRKIENQEGVADDLNALGMVYEQLGEYKKAIEYHKQALDIDIAVFGNKHPKVARDLNNLGLAWDNFGEHNEAIGYYEQALAIDMAVFGNKHPVVATMLNNMGLTWNNLGEYKKAIEYHKQALAIDMAIFGNKHPNVAKDLNNLGLAWDNLGEHNKAIGYYEQALAIDEAVYSNKHPSVARDLNNLGAAWYDLGDFQQAREYFLTAYSIFHDFFGNQHPRTKMTKEWLDRCKEFLPELIL